MTVETATMLVQLLGLYLLAGLLVGILYVFGGAGRIDPAAKGKGMPWRVRFLILPGIVGLWPLMLSKLLRQKEPPVS
ncbi:MAG: hypothetical protein AAFO63_07970 [Pseudomonadota bacterium]